MRVTILALGSHGDVQPFVPLGRALQGRGHRVRVATFAAFAPMLADAGLEFFPLRGDAQALLNTAGPDLMGGRQNIAQSLRSLQRSYFTLIAAWAEDLSDPALRDTEVLLNQLPGDAYGYDLAEHLGIPHAMVAVIPLVRTRHVPMMAFPASLAWLPGYSLLTYRLAEQMMWQACRIPINRWRAHTLGLRAVPLGGPFAAMDKQQIPVINGFSEHVVPRPPDWGGHVHLTGWWFPDDPGWDPPADLRRFLDGGAPPVFVGFGSMPVRNPAALTHRVALAVQQAGQRAVLHAGWAGLGQTELPPEFFALSYAPYGWLFPRMAAVVHHGGSGTAGSGFRSGVPSLVVPFGFDQFFWGRRAWAMGVGPRPIPIGRLTPERLAAALRQAVSDTDMRRRAAELGERIRAEDGLRRAVELIEQLRPA
jgi:sterol 3beta-glucosyltransferase